MTERPSATRAAVKTGLRLAVTPPLRLWLRVTGRAGTWPPPEPPRRLLVICCHWVGDTFWAYQAVRELQELWPDTELHVACKAHAPFLFRDLGPDRVWITPEITSDRHREPTSVPGLNRRARTLRALGVEGVVDLTGTRSSAYVTLRLRPRWSLGFYGDELAAVYTHRVRSPERPDAHLGERPCRVIEPLTGPRRLPDPLRFPAPRPDLAAAFRSQHGIGRGEPPAVVAPGAGWDAKRWAPEKFAEVCRLLAGRGRRVLVVGSAAETALCTQVVAAAGDRGLCLAGESLESLVEVLREDRPPVLVNDSGPGHLAAAAGCPTLAVFTGATSPRTVRPLGPRVRVIEAEREPALPRDIADWLVTAEPAGVTSPARPAP
jgi:ADP-heptose:LPS heptosyltransferase